MEQENSDYGDFIKEAYIDPIRSVLIVDDDYPTYTEILTSDTANNTQNKTWHENPEAILGVIRQFRQREPALIIDIHDGENISFEDEVNKARYLHQCDLLVLDFELIKGTNDGTLSINILRKVMSNNHFNLVVIYTQGELDEVFNNVRWGLITPTENGLSHDECSRAKELIKEAEDENENFFRSLKDSIDSEQYFYSRMNSRYCRTMAKNKPPYVEFARLTNEAEWELDDRKLVLRYLLQEIEKQKITDRGNFERLDGLTWSPFDEDRKWIWSNSAFVVFSNKSGDSDLIEIVAQALIDSNPSPSHLLLSRLRSEMDERGIAEQKNTLSYRHAQAYWYYRLLSTNDESRNWHIAESVSRHSEQLMEGIYPEVEDFVKRLVESDSNGQNAKKICKKYYNVDLDNENGKVNAFKEHNAFVCSTKPKGWHLTTGHIFRMCDQYWICMSPACDMEPSQVNSWKKKAYGQKRLPFIGIQLHAYNKNKTPEDISSNRYVYCDIQGTVEGFCFNSPEGENSSPSWHVLYAGNQGIFDDIDCYKFHVSRIKHTDDGLISHCCEAEVVAQLRYEYALNLLQKLGVNLTRIGLDFTDVKDL